MVVHAKNFIFDASDDIHGMVCNAKFVVANGGIACGAGASALGAFCADVIIVQYSQCFVNIVDQRKRWVFDGSFSYEIG